MIVIAMIMMIIVNLKLWKTKSILYFCVFINAQMPKDIDLNYVYDGMDVVSDNDDNWGVTIEETNIEQKQ